MDNYKDLNKQYVNPSELQTAKAINDRKINYPELGEQLDMLWHGMNENPSIRIEPFYSSIKEIKEKYSKNSGNNE